jgi:hypothetical protein
VPDIDLSTDPGFFALLADSYRSLVGSSLTAADQGPEWLYEKAPFGLLAHDAGEDPLFVYANRTAQLAFGYDWDGFTGLPSRLSAGPQDRTERQGLLDAVELKGFVDGYRGLRVNKSGAHFWIEDVTMWNLLDATGAYAGQAALFLGVSKA